MKRYKIFKLAYARNNGRNAISPGVYDENYLKPKDWEYLLSLGETICKELPVEKPKEIEKPKRTYQKKEEKIENDNQN